MAAFPQIDTEKFTANAEKAMAIPLGFASPLWFAYAGMASVGMTYWWMSQLSKPANLEAFSGMMEKYSPFAEKTFGKMPTLEVPAIVAEPVPAAAMPPMAAEPAFEEIITETSQTLIPEPALIAAALEPMTEAMEVVTETAPKIMEAAADDLTKLVGIGPTLATKLSGLGVKTFTDIAAWTADDVEKFDKSLNLMGRATREKWIDQARQFADQTAH